MRGRDGIGEFDLCVTPVGSGMTCLCCRELVRAAVAYDHDDRKDAVEDGVSLLRLHTGVGPYVGVTCGCYAKVQRQWAHINDSVRRKA